MYFNRSKIWQSFPNAAQPRRMLLCYSILKLCRPRRPFSISSKFCWVSAMITTSLANRKFHRLYQSSVLKTSSKAAVSSFGEMISQRLILWRNWVSLVLWFCTQPQLWPWAFIVTVYLDNLTKSEERKCFNGDRVS